jgi:hypothetical protein
MAGRPSVSSLPPEPMSLRAALARRALSGTEQDYTQLPLRRAVFLLVGATEDRLTCPTRSTAGVSLSDFAAWAMNASS